ncbi:MAG TPA: hypothetical protein VER98_00965 [Terriglobia bacterium]|nr:hypothetical protein [Terriglobia bacterium]
MSTTTVLGHLMLLAVMHGTPTDQDMTVPAPLTLIKPALLHADENGTASGLLTVHGDGKTAARLSLSEFRYRRADGNTYRSATTYKFNPLKTEDQQILDGAAPFPESLTFGVTVSNISEAGFGTAVLTRAGNVIPFIGEADGCIAVLRVPATYNIQIQSETPNHPEVIVSPSHSAGVRLVNSDPVTHRFEWQLRVNEGKLQSQSSVIHHSDKIDCNPNPSKAPNIIEVPANGSALIDMSSALDKPSGIRPLVTSGSLKDSIETAELMLTPVFDYNGIRPQAAKILPLWIRFRYWNDGWQEASNLLSLIVLLAIGGITSIWLHAGMPNTTRALALKNRLRATEDRVQGLGDSIDSRWRVLLAARVEMLNNRLFGTLWIFPSFAPVLDQLTSDLETFEAWVDCAYRVGLVLQELRDQLSQGVPPTTTAAIETHCRAALEPMETGFTTAEEIVGMRAACAAAVGLMEAVVNEKPIPELEATIKERENRLRTDKDVLTKCFGDCASLVEQVTVDPAPPLTPDNYLDRDAASLKLELLNSFRMLSTRITFAAAAAAGAGASVTGPSCPAMIRLHKYSSRFMNYLRPEGTESLQRAEMFLREMKEDIYTDDLLEEAEKTPPALDFVTVPDEIHAGAPILFRPAFKRGILNGAAARREWTCEWDFGDGSRRENGWAVFHYFRNPGDYSVVPTLYSVITGSPIAKLPPQQIRVCNGSGKPEQRVRWFIRLFPRAWSWLSPETKLEASRLMLVLATAVIGLIAVAQQRIESLSFLQAVGAVCALGFGADTLKNLVSHR